MSLDEELSEAFKKIHKLFGPGTSIGRDGQNCHIKVRQEGNLIKVGYGKTWEEAIADVKEVKKSRQ